MKVFFYLIGIFFILHELSWIFSPVKNANESRRFYHLVKSKKKLKLGEFTEEDKSLILSKTFTTLFYLLWMLIGLFSFNWLVFLAYLIVGFGIMSPLGLIICKELKYADASFLIVPNAIYILCLFANEATSFRLALKDLKSIFSISGVSIGGYPHVAHS
jgi:hypothetical protein